jgi:hypothetical protein
LSVIPRYNTEVRRWSTYEQGENRRREGSKETDRCPLTHAYICLQCSASNRNLHPVNLFRTWTYYLTVLLLQSVTDNLMETDQEGDGGGKRGNLKERMPEKGPELT